MTAVLERDPTEHDLSGAEDAPIDVVVNLDNADRVFRRVLFAAGVLVLLIMGMVLLISTHFGWIPCLALDGTNSDDPRSTASTFVAVIVVGFLVTYHRLGDT